MKYFLGLRGGGAVLLAAALVALACGPSSPAGSKGTITIASDLPTSGNDASSGKPTQNGVEYAIGTLKDKIESKGFKVVFKPYDDTLASSGKHDPQKGAQNVDDMLSDKTVLGMVGPFNSGVAAAEIPKANPQSLAMISASNTNECLTQDLPYCQSENHFTPASLRPSGKNNYFRLAAADTFQGPAMADYVSDTLKLTKLAVWDDQETFGKGVADNFAKEFKAKGGAVVSRKSYDSTTQSDFKDFLRDAAANGAQGVYVGGTSASKGCVGRGQSAGILDNAYWLGPDGLGDKQCITDSGAMANNKMYVTQGVGAVDPSNADAKKVQDGFKSKYPNPDDLGAYTFAAYDCAAVLIDAIARAIDSNGGNVPSRQQVVDAMAQTKDFKGLAGPIMFNKVGDPAQPQLQIQQNQGGNWVFLKNIAAPAS